MVYKLVARAESEAPHAPLVPVAKKAPDKPSLGGVKYAYRPKDADGVASDEVVGIGVAPADLADRGRNLIRTFVVGGEPVESPTLDEGRALHRAALAELPLSVTQLSRGEPVIPTVYERGAAEEGSA
jgi:nicotinate phosphoribosyltransferase